MRGRKFPRRRRQASLGAPKAARGGGWGRAGVGRMGARCAGCAGAASLGAKKPWGPRGVVARSSSSSGGGGARGAGKLPPPQPSEISELARKMVS